MAIWSLLVAQLHFSGGLNFDLVSTVAAAALDSRTSAAALVSAAAVAAAMCTVQVLEEITGRKLPENNMS